MLIKRNVMPKNIPDGLVTLFTLFIIPFVYYFELSIVLPRYFDKWGPWYLFHVIVGTFIFFNICSNYVAIILCDTSIRGRILPTTVGPNSRFCSVCECISPPRSWHCNYCDICILKRDHHCMFTSCCIGHDNMRYFYMFVLHLFIATLYASTFNLIFVLEYAEFRTWEDLFKLVFPLAAIFFTYSRYQLYTFVVLVVLIGCIFTGTLLYYHYELVLKGRTTNEEIHKIGAQYDFGRKQNIIETLGDKWYLVWLSPFIESKLPHDGVNWDTKQSNKAK